MAESPKGEAACPSWIEAFDPQLFQSEAEHMLPRFVDLAQRQFAEGVSSDEVLAAAVLTGMELEGKLPFQAVVTLAMLAVVQLAQASDG